MAPGPIFRWYLETITDTFDNSIGYRYATDEGSNGEPFRQLYLSQVDYAAHPGSPAPYAVDFQRQLGEDACQRPDAFIDGRAGFQVLTRCLLGQIAVRFGSQIVRRYDLRYRTGNYGKTLLTLNNPVSLRDPSGLVERDLFSDTRVAVADRRARAVSFEMSSGEKVIAGVTFGLGILLTAGLAELALGGVRAAKATALALTAETAADAVQLSGAMVDAAANPNLQSLAGVGLAAGDLVSGPGFGAEVNTARVLATGGGARIAADAAQAMRPRPPTAAALETNQGTFVGVSGSGQPLHPRVQTVRGRSLDPEPEFAGRVAQAAHELDQAQGRAFGAVLAQVQLTSALDAGDRAGAALDHRRRRDDQRAIGGPTRPAGDQALAGHDVLALSARRLTALAARTSGSGRQAPEVTRTRPPVHAPLGAVCVPVGRVGP
jgi:hypothetical protein